MPNHARRAIAATSQPVFKGAGAITSASLDNSGKAPPASLPGGSAILDDKKIAKADDGDEVTEEVTKYFVPVLKASDEEQTVTGVVLQPETTDAHGDIYDAEVIKRAAHGFMASYKGPSNAGAKLGLMHKEFKPRFVLLESYLAPQDLVINSRTIKAGSWIMTVKVLDEKVWEMVKAGKLTGFSIGGKAKVKKLAA